MLGTALYLIMNEEESIQAILLDIEGTTSSISFVYDEMFPFVRRELNGFLDQFFNEESTREACLKIAEEAQSDHGNQKKWVAQEVLRLMDSDSKTTGLKMLQGLIWKSGFESGELRAHVYPDFPEALKRWNEQGYRVEIYSSGSVKAQKLFFKHTECGDLLPHLKGHYDTQIGAKQDSSSYQKIAQSMNLEPHEVHFFSDVPEELEAAQTAGMKATLVVRPGNKPVDQVDRFDVISSFESSYEACDK